MRSVCLMAFCNLYVQDPLKWSSQTINKILINGAKVVKDNYEHAKDNGPLDCVLNVENCIAKIRIDEPVFLDTFGSSPSLIDTVQTFFDSHQHGLFRCLNLCYLIWKTNGIYFIFDGQGSGSAADDKNGFASLVCTESIRDVSKLLKTLSSIKSDDCYSVSVIKMKHFRQGVSDYAKPRIQYVGTNTYKIVNDCYAILSGKFHVEHNGFQSFRKRQSITVNLMALIYHAIQPANSWNSQLIDKIILLGTKLFHECKKSPQGEVTIQHLPRSYSVLDYKFKIDYKPYDHSGQMSYSLAEMEKNLLMYLKRAFPATAKNASVFIQTNSFVFSVWESNNYYYLFDAYARNQVGEIADDQSGMACIQMHGSLESLCNNLATNLNALAAKDGFVLHGINVAMLTSDGKPVADTDLELINAFMDDMFWSEMNNFQESSARSEEVCNLDESSDDDIFMDTVLGEKRTASSIDSSDSRCEYVLVDALGWGTAADRKKIMLSSNHLPLPIPFDHTDLTCLPLFFLAITSSLSGSGTADSRTDDSSSKTSGSNDDSDSQGSKAVKTKKDRSKSPKSRKRDKGDDDLNKQVGGVDADDVDADDVDADDVGADDLDAEEKTEKKKGKGKKSKKSKNDAGDVNDEHNKKGKGRKGKRKSKDKADHDGKDAPKQSLVVVESSSGTESSISKLLTTSFKISNRVLLATEWGDFFVAFEGNNYFLIDGCLCDYNALIQINLKELDSSKKITNINGIVSQIMQLKSSKNVTIRSENKDVKGEARSTEIAEVQPPFCSNVDAPMWELIEGMIELMKTTAKFDKIKGELV